MSDADPSVPYGYCECGCGGETNVVNGTPRRLVHGHRPGRAKYYLQPDGSKVCYRCGECKHQTDFTVETRMSDGLNRMCKVCKHKSNRAFSGDPEREAPRVLAANPRSPTRERAGAQIRTDPRAVRTVGR